jgi:predicted ATP-dependent serine protease
MNTEPKCRTCGVHYPQAADGWDGECPSCADRSSSIEEILAEANALPEEERVEFLRSHVQGNRMLLVDPQLMKWVVDNVRLFRN